MAAAHSSLLAPDHDGLALDLGSGPCPAPGYVGVDLCSGQSPDQVISWDLTDGSPWPFDDASVHRLYSSHFIEHIPRSRVVTGSTAVRRTIRSPGKPKRIVHTTIATTQDAFFWFFDEAFRVARSGCCFELRWPHPQSDEADQDPTHTRRIPVQTLSYLSREGRRALNTLQYPVACDWHIVAGSVLELALDERLEPFRLPDGSFDFAAAKRCHGVFHEIRATLIKP